MPVEELEQLRMVTRLPKESEKMVTRTKVTTKGKKRASQHIERSVKGPPHKTERRTRNEVATSMDKKMARLRAMRKKK